MKNWSALQRSQRYLIERGSMLLLPGEFAVPVSVVTCFVFYLKKHSQEFMNSLIHAIKPRDSGMLVYSSALSFNNYALQIVGRVAEKAPASCATRPRTFCWRRNTWLHLPFPAVIQVTLEDTTSPGTLLHFYRGCYCSNDDRVLSVLLPSAISRDILFITNVGI